MELEGEFFVGFFDLGFVGSFGDAQDVVVVFFPHHESYLLLRFGLLFVHGFNWELSYKCKFYMTIDLYKFADSI